MRKIRRRAERIYGGVYMNLKFNTLITGPRNYIKFMEKVMLFRYVMEHGDLPFGNKMIG